MTRVALAAVVALVMSVATAGAVIASGGAADRTARSLSVELDEWTITRSEERVAAGSLTLGQTNAGAVEHELLIVRTELPADELPIGLEGVSPATAGKVVYGKQHAHHTGTKARGRHLQPKDSKRERISLRPGRYVLLCSIPGHYEAGQRATLRVD